MGPGSSPFPCLAARAQRLNRTTTPTPAPSPRFQRDPSAATTIRPAKPTVSWEPLIQSTAHPRTNPPSLPARGTCPSPSPRLVLAPSSTTEGPRPQQNTQPTPSGPACRNARRQTFWEMHTTGMTGGAQTLAQSVTACNLKPQTRPCAPTTTPKTRHCSSPSRLPTRLYGTGP